MRNTWKKVRKESGVLIAELSRHVKGYSYETAEASRKTEEAIFSLVSEGLERIRSDMHSIMNLGFELHHDDLAEKARLVMDMTSPAETYASVPKEWPRLPLEFLKKLVMKDSVIVLGVLRLAEDSRSLAERFHEAVKTDKEYKKELPAMEKVLVEMAASLENLSDVLRERDRLRDIRAEQMKRALEEMEEET